MDFEAGADSHTLVSFCAACMQLFYSTTVLTMFLFDFYTIKFNRTSYYCLHNAMLAWCIPWRNRAMGKRR